ncbi:MAG: hypothetical protein CMF62_00840 [Magnetococcales bacterium]|nr:hypothetical protein [Magnetococcales bacterium]|tara:strand:+ start:5339 stop:7264 length:1926 start_codon:yes stop_codon:yes gene_type:complete
MSDFYSTALKTDTTTTTMASTEEVSAPIKGKEEIMIKNYDNGYTFSVDIVNHVLRVLILGTSSNYYKSGEEMTSETLQDIKRYVDEGNGKLVLKTIRDVFVTGRAPKQQPTMMLLAYLARTPDSGKLDESGNDTGREIRRGAFEILKKDFRTIAQAYMFKKMHQSAGTSKGWGRMSKDAFSEFFKARDARELAYQAFKYGNREGWSFRDLMRCVHLKGSDTSPAFQLVIRSLVTGFDDIEKRIQDGTIKLFIGADTFAKALATKLEINLDHAPTTTESSEATELKNVYQYLTAIRTLKSMTTEDESRIPEICDLVQKHRFTREFLPTWSLRSTSIWESLLFDKTTKQVKMPFNALIRNLTVMTQRGIFDTQTYVDAIASQITNDTAIQKSRIHPVSLLVAYFAYSNSQYNPYESYRGLNRHQSETVHYHPTIGKALETAFYKSFGNVTPTGKRIWHLIDASGSMQSHIATLPSMTAFQAAVIMSMTYSKTEDPATQTYYVFSSTRGKYYLSGIDMQRVYLTPDMTLAESTKTLSLANWGCTNLALPVERALKMAKEGTSIDTLPEVFMLYTDNDVNTGRHVNNVLKEYREVTGLDAKMVVIATTASKSTVADPTMPESMMDVVGFDTAAPDVVSQFIMGSI